MKLGDGIAQWGARWISDQKAPCLNPVGGKICSASLRCPVFEISIMVAKDVVVVNQKPPTHMKLVSDQCGHH